MTPAERVGDAAPRLLQRRPRRAPVGMRRAGVGPGFQRAAIAARASGSTGVVAAWSR